MRFADIPKTIVCPNCGSTCTRSTASSGRFSVHAGYHCAKCYRVVSRSWPRLEDEGYPPTFECPECGQIARPSQANEAARVVYEHKTNTTIHQFELEFSDQGWGLWRGRAEITRVYEARWDCCTVPG